MGLFLKPEFIERGFDRKAIFLRLVDGDELQVFLWCQVELDTRSVTYVSQYGAVFTRLLVDVLLSQKTVPDSGNANPQMIRRRLVFPQPFAPLTSRISPV